MFDESMEVVEKKKKNMEEVSWLIMQSMAKVV
jgi:hypothetical protein